MTIHDGIGRLPCASVRLVLNLAMTASRVSCIAVTVLLAHVQVIRCDQFRELIIEGYDVESAQYPFIVALLSCTSVTVGQSTSLYCSGFCSGSLIAPDVVWIPFVFPLHVLLRY